MASPSGLKRVPVIDNWTILEWLLIVEDQGVRVCDGTISKIYAKTIICKSRLECDFSMSDGKSLGYNDISHIGDKWSGEHKVDGDLEMADSMDAMFLPVPRLLKFTATDVTRKRKDEGNDERDKPVKLVKCVNGNSRRERGFPLGDYNGLSCGNEAGNPVSVEH